METIITNVGSFFTWTVTSLGDILGVIAEDPLLLIMCVGMPVAGFVVGYVGRLFRAA